MSKIFVPNVLNIFCDASIIQNPDNTYIGCPGAVAVMNTYKEGTNIIKHSHMVLNKSTNNNSEITAILLGVYLALELRQPDYAINIFSDSKISVFGLREWIFKWVNNKVKGEMYSSSGTIVANQDVFLKIIKRIVDNNLTLNLWHVKGHVKDTNEKSMVNAQKCFKASNQVELDLEDIASLSYYNNYIDNLTRDILTTGNFDNMQEVLPSAIYYDPSKETIVKYKELIK